MLNMNGWVAVLTEMRYEALLINHAVPPKSHEPPLHKSLPLYPYAKLEEFSANLYIPFLYDSFHPLLYV
jgi:hypothetical protein